MPLGEKPALEAYLSDLVGAVVECRYLSSLQLCYAYKAFCLVLGICEIKAGQIVANSNRNAGMGRLFSCQVSVKSRIDRRHQ